MLWASVPCAAWGSSELQVTLRAAGAPVAGAVVSLQPLAAAPRLSPVTAVMDQVNSEFMPRVLVVQSGSSVSFPNSDVTRHQVYSFSPAKRFELPLYSGTPPAPIKFEQAGVVTLGCNIHDWMIGYVVVLDTPYYASTDAAGSTRLSAPAGRYRLQLWHERLRAPALVEREVEVGAEAATLELEVSLAPPPPPRGDDRLRALQEKLRSQRRDP